MELVRANGIDITYDVCGSGEPLLLIMGLGGQLTDWPQPFVDLLADHFTVIRFDNRDSGLSSRIEAPKPTRRDLILASLRRSNATLPYRLQDMADDTAALLDHLRIDKAHVVGMSMGGMIAQALTLARPDLVATLTSIMSNTGNRFSGRPSPRVLAHLARRGEPAQAEALDVTMELFALVGGPDWDADTQRARTSVSLARAYNPAGVLRQSQAIAAAPDRTKDLASVFAPTLVVHGLDDRLIRPSGGRATARAIPNSRLLLFPRMGHDLPAGRHRELVEAIVTNSQRTM